MTSKRTKSARRGTRTRGFTLIELLVVVAILGLLASIAIPSYGRMTARARGSEFSAYRAKMVQIIDAFTREHNRFPEAAGDDWVPEFVNWDANSPLFPGKQAVANFDKPDWKELVAYGLPTTTSTRLRFRYQTQGGAAFLTVCHNFDLDDKYTCDGITFVKAGNDVEHWPWSWGTDTDE